MAAGPTGTATTSASTSLVPMCEQAAKMLSKEEKRQNHKNDMKSLRRNLLAGGSGATAPSRAIAAQAQSATAPRAQDGGGKDDDGSSISAGPVGDSGGEDPAFTNNVPRYVDRAKLRRSVYGTQHGLSDADPPAAKRSRQSPQPSRQQIPQAPAAPSYGPGAALFQKMLNGGGAAQHSSEEVNSTGTRTDLPTNGSRSGSSGIPSMGKVIEVRSMAGKSAGLGSGAMREGVEQHTAAAAGARTDWKHAARQRRWDETR